MGRLISPVQTPLRGKIQLPGDKSISHRYALLGGMANGRTHISNFASSADCQATLSCLKTLGVQIVQDSSRIEISSHGWRRLVSPNQVLNAHNSGTTIRLLSALLAAGNFTSTVQGDASLNGRPMQRIMDPLTKMGARIWAREDRYPPLVIHGTRLHGIQYQLPIASAQVKSCVLLAGLMAEGETVVQETGPSRDHTERALPFFGASLSQNGSQLRVQGRAQLNGAKMRIPGDFSSAVYFLVASLLIPDSNLTLMGVGVNPSRVAFLSLLEKSGVEIKKSNPRKENGEPVCDLHIRSNPRIWKQFPRVISGDWVANLIDEIPALALLGIRLEKGLVVKDAQELRKKESDRIHSIVFNLNQLGVDVKELPDGFIITAGSRIRGGMIRTFGDHGIAMAFSLAGLVSENPVELDQPECVAISYPEFFHHLEEVCSW